ncbi:nitrate/nitrite transporter NrtS [Vibrio sp. ZSDE26]|uniref:Nitrate/nitrite transporter NrtS n=1 Tax=Vibrio amylolyticus TaxID=2847292 RepID=A0A9X2BJW4_9VIBR|nr:nitrate/nitrite transporter NrtS [Vibrio amylolyticus]
MLNRKVIKRAAWIALIVGTLLNIINQHDAIFFDASIQWIKIGLTYCVPFFVSLISSIITMRDMAQEHKK